MDADWVGENGLPIAMVLRISKPGDPPGGPCVCQPATASATLRRARILSSNCVTSSRPTVKALGDCDAAGDPRGTSVIRTRGNFLAGILPEPLAAAVRSIEAAPMSTVGA